MGMEDENDVMKEMVETPLLVLDDIGKVERSDPRFVQRVLFGIIDGRYGNDLPIVLTSNLDPRRLEKYLGGAGSNEASMDRLIEMAGQDFIKMVGESYRRK